jgi:Rod binding domain-containing protein
MNMTPISEISPSALPENQSKLKEACDGVEGLFMKMLLKEGMQSMMDNAEGHTASALGYALEQTAEEIARNGETGIADSIYEQLSANI